MDLKSVLRSPGPVATLILALALSPLLASPLYPIVDYYLHTIRLFYLAGGDGFPELDRYYAADWGLVPNILGDLAGIAFFTVFDPLTASRLFLAFVLATIFAGCMTLAWANGSRAQPLTAVLCALFLFNEVFVLGFTNFLFGFGLSLFAIALWVWSRESGRLRLAFAGAAALSVPLYLAHGFAYMMFGCILAAYEAGRFAEQRVWRWDRALRVAAGLLLTAVPAAGVVLYTGFSGQGGHAGLVERVMRHIENGTLLESRVQLAGQRLSLLARQFETGSAAFDHAFNATLALAILALLAFRVVTVRQRWVWVFGFLGIAFLSLPSIFFGVFFVADRIPCIALILFAAVATPCGQRPRGRAVSGFLCLLILRSAALIQDWSGDAEAQRGALAWARLFKPGDVVVSIYPGNGSVRFRPRCQMFPAAFVWTAGVGAFTFSQPGVQPLRITGHLREVLGDIYGLPPDPATGTALAPRNDTELAYSDWSRADYMVSCHVEQFPRDPFANATLIAESGPYRLYARIPKPGG